MFRRASPPENAGESLDRGLGRLEGSQHSGRRSLDSTQHGAPPGANEPAKSRPHAALESSVFSSVLRSFLPSFGLFGRLVDFEEYSRGSARARGGQEESDARRDRASAHGRRVRCREKTRRVGREADPSSRSRVVRSPWKADLHAARDGALLGEASRSSLERGRGRSPIGNASFVFCKTEEPARPEDVGCPRKRGRGTVSCRRIFSREWIGFWQNYRRSALETRSVYSREQDRYRVERRTRLRQE